MQQKIHQITSYLKFRRQAHSTKGHGVHSPFVYNLIEQVFNHSGQFYAFNGIEQQREALLQIKDKVKVKDLGAGSTVSKSNMRSVKSIAKNALLPAREAQLLFRLINRFQPKTILELGTSLGLTTAYLASAKRQAQVYTIEGCPLIKHIAEQHFNILGIRNIHSFLGDFKEVLPQLLQSIETVDFAFIDGHHAYEPTMQYFHWILPKTTPQSVLIFDDIYWSEPMTRAWQDIKAHPQVTVTIDLFRMGMVFFRKESSKENFKVRF